MMSLDTMLFLRREAARKASRNNTLPAFWVRTLGGLNKRIPFIGDYRPNGYVLVDGTSLVIPEGVPAGKVTDPICNHPYLEVDISGHGTPEEPVLTGEEMLALAEANPDVGWALVEVGQFQGVVGAFRMAGTPCWQ